MAAESTVFADVYNGFAGTLINGSTAAADALLNAAAPQLASLLGLFVIVNGVMVFLQRMQWNMAVLNCVRAIVVANLLTVGLYNQYVQTMFLTTIPGWIAGATNGGGVSLNVAEQFDKLRSAIDHQAGVLWTATDSESWGRMVADRLSITVAAQWDVFGLWIAFLIDFIAECLMAVVAPIGAVVMLAYLFNNTRHWAERWIGKLVALSLLELLVAIELQITMTQFNAYMGKTEAASGSRRRPDHTDFQSLGCRLGFPVRCGDHGRPASHRRSNRWQPRLPHGDEPHHHAEQHRNGCAPCRCSSGR